MAGASARGQVSQVRVGSVTGAWRQSESIQPLTMVIAGLYCQPHKCHCEREVVPGTRRTRLHLCPYRLLYEQVTESSWHLGGGGRKNPFADEFLCQRHVAAKWQSWDLNLGGRLQSQASGMPRPQWHWSLSLLVLPTVTLSLQGPLSWPPELGSVLETMSWSPSLVNPRTLIFPPMVFVL